MLNKIELKEIKAGQSGTGLLVEQDGYISLLDERNKQLYESIQLNENSGDGWHVPYPFIVSAIFQKANVKNQNQRIYPEDILRKQVELYQQKIKERRAYGELNHPSDTTIDLGRIAMNILELHWDNKTVVGKLELITSRAFRNSGVVTTMGDIAANLLINKLKIGVSSRGVGSVENKFGTMVVGPDFELICWDLVSDPSTPNAWIGETPEELQQYIESAEKFNDTILIEKLEKFKEIL
jgi:hypothetical protein